MVGLGAYTGDFDQRGTRGMIMRCIRCGEMAQTDIEPLDAGPHQHVFESGGSMLVHKVMKLVKSFQKTDASTCKL